MQTLELKDVTITENDEQTTARLNNLKIALEKATHLDAQDKHEINIVLENLSYPIIEDGLSDQERKQLFDRLGLDSDEVQLRRKNRLRQQIVNLTVELYKAFRMYMGFPDIDPKFDEGFRKNYKEISKVEVKIVAVNELQQAIIAGLEEGLNIQK